MTKWVKELLAVAIILFVIWFVLSLVLKGCNNSKDIGIYSDWSKPDTVYKTRDIDSTEYAKVEVKLISYEMMLNSKDSLINELRQDVKKAHKNLETVTFLLNETKAALSTKVVDTYYVKGSDTVLTKMFAFKDDWADIKGKLRKDSVDIDYKIRNEYSLMTKWQSNGFLGLGKKDLYVEVHSLNPNTYTTGMHSYKIEDRHKRFYETKLFMFLLGVGSGILIDNAVK